MACSLTVYKAVVRARYRKMNRVPYAPRRVPTRYCRNEIEFHAATPRCCRVDAVYQPVLKHAVL